MDFTESMRSLDVYKGAIIHVKRRGSPFTHLYNSRVPFPGAFLEVFHETTTSLTHHLQLWSNHILVWNLPFQSCFLRLLSPWTTYSIECFTCSLALSSSSPFPSLSRSSVLHISLQILFPYTLHRHSDNCISSPLPFKIHPLLFRRFHFLWVSPLLNSIPFPHVSPEFSSSKFLCSDFRRSKSTHILLPLSYIAVLDDSTDSAIFPFFDISDPIVLTYKSSEHILSSCNNSNSLLTWDISLR